MFVLFGSFEKYRRSSRFWFCFGGVFGLVWEVKMFVYEVIKEFDERVYGFVLVRMV